MKKILICLIISILSLSTFAVVTEGTFFSLITSIYGTNWLKAEAIREEAVEHLSTNGEMEQSEMMKDFLKDVKSSTQFKGLTDLEIMEKFVSEETR